MLRNKAAVLLASLVLACAARGAAGETWVAKRTLKVGLAWAGHPVGFAFATRGEDQYVGWYDENRDMVFAQRKLGSDKWALHKTRQRTGWDSHNYIALAFDVKGQLHVAADMHCSKLRYWRSQRPGDAGSLKAINRMTGREEGRCTYPKFIAGAGGRLFFMYRDGGSGNGRRLVNAYDAAAGKWTRFLSKPLFSGKARGRTMNAYPVGLRTDPKGVTHVAWVWRDSPDCSTNHDLCYARSADFKTWTNSKGEKLALPITVNTAEKVDPVPARGGLHNWGNNLAFDLKNRPLITYIKFDKKGNNQVWAARLETGKWKIYQLTQWKHRVFFRGGGSIVLGFGWSALRPAGDGKSLELTWHHVKYGNKSMLQRFDPETLKPLGKPTPLASPWPKEVTKVRSKFPGMTVRLRASAPLKRGGKTVRYLLRWETLGQNRDRPRKKYPKPGPLEIIELEKR